MRTINQAEQGSLEWHIARMGKVTGSNMSKVIGTIRARQTYFDTLKAERSALADGTAEQYIAEHSFSNAATEWGHEHEDVARANYEIAMDTDVEQVGFILLRDHDGIGCSLDGLVGTFGTIEIKCPFRLENHAATCRDGMPAKHVAQVQAGMWIAEREWCDFISYNPNHTTTPLFIQRIALSPRYETMMQTAALEFARCLDLGEDLPEYQTKGEGEIPALF